MASNQHISGAAMTDQIFEFGRAVSHLTIWIDSGVIFSLSFDNSSFMTMPAGLHQMPVGVTKTVYITSDGAWHIVGAQA